MRRFLLFILFAFTLFGSLSAQSPNDCFNVLTVCGNANLMLNSSGPGIDDFSLGNNFLPPCGVFENQSLWLEIPIQTSGLLGFNLTPNSGDDFDFAMFGPDVNCLNLGSPVRCSWADPSFGGLVTGMNAGALDTSEDNTGDGFVSLLSVQAGETYYLLIDNFSNSNQGFELEWTGNAFIAGQPIAFKPANPQVCDTDNDVLEAFDLRPLVDEIAGNQNDVTVTFHRTEEDAILGNSPLGNSYVGIDGEQIFARVTFDSNGCASITDFRLEILDNPENTSITGPSSVCPNTTDIVYSVMGDASNTQEWFINGGTIKSPSNTNQIMVDWGNTSNTAFLKVVPTSPEGCIGDTLRLDVTINTRLEPETPIGPTEVCLSGATEAVYSVPLSNGSIYEWSVENGTFLSSNSSNEVTIRWDGSLPGKISFREFNPSIADCEGFSDTLDITFLPEIFVAPRSVNVLCFGESTGSIALNATGGLEPFNITWTDGGSGSDRTGLSSGDYEYTITDANLCEVSGTITITEPPDLQITSSQSLDLSCFQDSTGFVEVNPEGGVSPYSYQWTGNGRSLNIDQASISDLPAGNYSVVVTDDNGCTTSESFVLTEPPLLEPDLDQLINQPICPQTSDGEVTVGAKGGTPDYLFTWDLAPVQTSPTATGLSKGVYTVTIEDSNGCTTSQTVEVTEQFPRVHLPNAFTPNGDNHNDTFVAVANCDLNEFQMFIFNQWGNTIFNSNNIKMGWDGTFEGKPVPIGNYTYQVAYRFRIDDQDFSETIRGGLKVFR